jgi:hypothetical protein
LRRSSIAQLRRNMPPHAEPVPPSIEVDPRWRLTQRVVAGAHFARSPLLAKFLLFVVAETLERRQTAISEHQIGIQVFGRPPSYRTVEDNIVRNYARQLRKRLADHFAGPGAGESMRIEVPVGGYVPRFIAQPAVVPDPVLDVNRDAELHEGSLSMPRLPLRSQSHFESQHAENMKPFVISRRIANRPFTRVILGALYSLLLIAATWFAASYLLAPPHSSEPAQVLWKSILQSTNTYIIPPDVGFNLLEDLNHDAVPLAKYIKGSYLSLPAGPLDSHTDRDLRTQQFTDFVSLQFVAMLARLPEYDPQRVHLRFPRDLLLDDLKSANAVIIGSASSNPWAAIADKNTNFRVVPGQDMQSASIVNLHPQTGEAATYQSHWNEPAHETYALIVFTPNLSGSGHLLLLEGLDVAGTEAAAEAIFHSDLISPILQRARRPDGTLRPFEILLRSNSIQSNAEGAQIVASRIV